MTLRSIKELKNLKGKKVLLRTGFDVPLSESGQIDNDFRIRAGLPTIKYLIKKEATIIILNHLGRPKGKVVNELSNKKISQRLSKLLNKKVVQINDLVSQETEEKISKFISGEIVMLENVRFHRGEAKNNYRHARKLARYGNIYVNDAFSNSHRQETSMVAITRYLPAYSGLLLEKEVNNLNKIFLGKTHPRVAIIGGAKLKTKVGVIKSLLNQTDYLLLGGAVANNVLKDMNYEVGLSKVDKTQLKLASNILINKLKLPVDVVVARSFSPEAKNQIKAVGRIVKKDIILDLGPDTITLYSEIIKKAKLIIWNGPLGYFEVSKYKKSSQEIAKAISQTKAFSIVGGGETIEMIQGLKLLDKFNFISTGGGAMLEFLEGKTLPGIKPLIKK